MGTVPNAVHAGASAVSLEELRQPRTLSLACSVLNRTSTSRRLWAKFGLGHLGRAWIRGHILPALSSYCEGITVLMGLRDRADYRLKNALKSIRNQQGLPRPPEILVVDYGSRPANAEAALECCRQFSAGYVHVSDVAGWSRGRCLNIGLRRVRSELVMTTDVDMVFPQEYLADAVRTLQSDPFTLVCAPMYDLCQDSSSRLMKSALEDEPLEVDRWKKWAEVRYGWGLHPSILCTYTAYFHMLRGYDEFYKVWGSEDEDMMRRFESMGLRRKRGGEDSFYLHQWHPKFEGIEESGRSRTIAENKAYLNRRSSLIRNGLDWGQAKNALPGTLPC